MRAESGAVIWEHGSNRYPLPQWPRRRCVEDASPKYTSVLEVAQPVMKDLDGLQVLKGVCRGSREWSNRT